MDCEPRPECTEFRAVKEQRSGQSSSHWETETYCEERGQRALCVAYVIYVGLSGLLRHNPAMDGGKDVGPPGGHDGSVVASLLDPHRPTFLFGCTPPSRKMPRAKVREICKKFVSRGRVLASDGFIVYDVQDESSRTAEERPFPFRTLWDSSWYAGIVTSESNKQCVVYKAAPCDAGFSDWLRDCVEKDGHSALTIVGAPSSKQKHPGPSTKDACKLTAAVPGVHFGCVCIAERHVKNRCEHEILIKKMQWGAEWFITQGIYDPQPMIAVIKDYSRRCRELKLKPKKIVLTFTPVGGRRPWFHQVVGMRVPDHVEQRIFGGLDQTAPSDKRRQECFRWQHHGKRSESHVSPKTKKTRKKLRGRHL